MLALNFCFIHSQPNATKDIHDHVEMSIQAEETCLKMTKYLGMIGVDDDEYHTDKGHDARGSPAPNFSFYCICIRKRSIATTLSNVPFQFSLMYHTGSSNRPFPPDWNYFRVSWEAGIDDRNRHRQYSDAHLRTKSDGPIFQTC